VHESPPDRLGKQLPPLTLTSIHHFRRWRVGIPFPLLSLLPPSRSSTNPPLRSYRRSTLRAPFRERPPVHCGVSGLTRPIRPPISHFVRPRNRDRVNHFTGRRDPKNTMAGGTRTSRDGTQSTCRRGLVQSWRVNVPARNSLPGK